MSVVQALLGIVVFHLLIWALSEDRARITWRIAVIGLALQFAIALLLVYLPPARALFDGLNAAMLALQTATEAGTSFVFGFLGGGAPPVPDSPPQGWYVLALRALPLVLVVSALSRVLTYWRVLPLVVRLLSRALERALGIGGALAFSAAANVFLGQTEAPLLIRPYLAALSRSELFAVMTTGMATIAGTVFALYAQILGPVLPDASGHLLVASLMSLPAALAYSLILVPPSHHTGAEQRFEREDEGTLDALANGTTQGLSLYLNVVAMLLVMVATVHLVDLGIGQVQAAGAPLSLARMLGWTLAPLCWLIGVPWSECVTAGGLLGVKVVLNELLAYLQMSQLPSAALGEHSRLIMTYALCGFANLGSLGMLLAGLGVMVPERRREVVELGARSVLVGVLATCTTGAVIGLVT
ncbi:MAG: NupC/NupG family nucleoside CNT transporter [Gammaproteobacteria bacterium]